MSKRRNQPLIKHPPALKATFVIAILTVLAILAQTFLREQEMDNIVVLQDTSKQTTPIQLAPGKTHLTDDFVTHLPLIVFDTGDAEPGAEGRWSEAKGYYVPAKGNPYAVGSLSVIDNDNGENRLTDTPTMQGNMQMRLRGNSSLSFPKKQYLVEFLDEDGSKGKQDVLGMGAESDWVLNISWQDPSLMRNYLAYTMGKATDVQTPDARYCELVRRRNGTYEYLGVYLMMENIKQGAERVDIPKYRPNQTLSFILRRDRYDEAQINLNTYATEKGLSQGILGVKYPNKEKIAPQDIPRIEEKISNFEKVLYAEDVQTFLTYRNYIDLSSFVDYFLFNELLMNYDAGYNSTYLYLDYTGRLVMGPFWDFDQSLSNDMLYKSKLDSTAFHNAPWFKQMLRDPNFVLELEKRYHEMRSGHFSDAALKAVTDNAQQYLGSAAQRDWNRWQYKTTMPLNPYGIVPQSFDEAMKSLEEALFTHAKWLDAHIDSLYQFSDPSIPLQAPEEIAREQANRYGDLLALTFVGIFIISALLLRREL